MTGAHDVGRVLNRLGIEGQIEGGIVMGQGYAMTEELIVEDGVVRNPDFRDYKLVTAPEIPEMDIHFIETMDGEGPQGAKGVGEAPAICIAAAVANAIHNATGVRIYELPFTPEKVYRALHRAATGHRLMRRRTVLSLEQALSLPYATLRFVQLGWRVIRIEPTPSGEGLPGDPNRYIGRNAVDDDRRSVLHRAQCRQGSDCSQSQGFAWARDASTPAALTRRRRVLLQRRCRARYRALGIDYETLSAVKPDLIWAGISALGPGHPEVPGYDPVLQAMAGYMEITGDPEGPPMVAGLPIVDLKSGDEVYANVLLALVERAETGCGRRIDVSMLQAAASWLITTLPLVDFDCDPSEITRAGNEHRKFIPTNVYPTKDGFVYLAVGSDVQWKRLTATPMFAPVARPSRATNAGRQQERAELRRDMAAVTQAHPTNAVAAALSAATIPWATINDIRQVRDLAALAGTFTTTRTPQGRTIRMQPAGVNLPAMRSEYPFPPKYAEHTRPVLAEAGFAEDEIAALARERVIGGY